MSLCTQGQSTHTHFLITHLRLDAALEVLVQVAVPQRDRKVFSYEAQMTRLEEEIQRYKKLELGLYENFVEGIINKAEYPLRVSVSERYNNNPSTRSCCAESHFL